MLDPTTNRPLRFPKFQTPSRRPSSLPRPILNVPNGAMTAWEFEKFSRIKMEEHYGTVLLKKRVSGIPKIFDHVSMDDRIAGDAKYLTLQSGDRRPNAKFSIIAEHVWLLEKTTAEIKFLVFGNDVRVPEDWLMQYNILVRDVEFYFLKPDGELRKLN